MKRSSVLTVLLGVLLYAPLSGALKDYVNTLTGNIHTRIIWLHGNVEERMTGGGALWGFDSETGVTTQLAAASSNLYYLPILCSGGHRIVVTTINDFKVYVVNWDGTGMRYICRGVASDVWEDPATGKEWVIISTRTSGTWNSGEGIISRVMIDDPSQSKTLFNAWSIKGESWYQVSGDGTLAAALLPWNKVYHIANGGLVTNGPTTEISAGCWSSVAPDDSKYWFHLDYVDGHDRIRMFKDKTNISMNVSLFPGSVPVNTLETEMYHPRFASNGARFILITAGYTGNRGAATAEVYFGKFNSTYTEIPDWIRMTRDDISDYFPDAWIGVTSQKSLNLDKTSLEFAVALGGSEPDAQTVTVTGVGELDINTISVTEDAGWLNTSVSGSGDTRTITNSINTADLIIGTQTASVIITADGETAQYAVTLSVTDPSAYHKKFDFGDSPVTGWESADAYLAGGKNVATTKTVTTAGITYAAPAAAYQTCRHSGVDFRYAVPNGTYTVRCHTVEWYYTTMAEALANRSMDITIEGELVEDNMSPAEKAGALETAAVLEYPVTVSDGTLDLTVVNDGGNDAYLMGLEIVGGATGISDYRSEISDFRFETAEILYDVYGRRINRQTAPAGIYLLNGPEGLRKIVISK